MFEPVTMTRSASALAPVGAAACDAGEGDASCANALNVVKRKIPVAAATSSFGKWLPGFFVFFFVICFSVFG
jgi:hypothetical protein